MKIDNEIANELEQLAPAITRAVIRLRYDHPKGGQEQSVLPEFEEWWEGLGKTICERDHDLFRKADGIVLGKSGCMAIYNSLKSMVRTITDEEVVARFNEIPTDKLEVGFPQEGGHFKSVIRVCHPNYRLKPQEPQKEPWEVVYGNSRWEGTGQVIKDAYREAYEAATKGGGE